MNFDWGGKKKSGWNHISPEETKAGAVIAYRHGWRYYRPWMALLVFIVTMTVCGICLLDMIDASPLILFPMLGAWSAIAAGETDADSPLNQTLFDKIRGNLNANRDLIIGDNALGSGETGHDHDGTDSLAIFSIKHINGTGLDDTNILIDSTIDWRDRYIFVTGTVHWATTANVTKFVPGGASDNQIYFESGLTVGTDGFSLAAALFLGWMYGEAGVAGPGAARMKSTGAAVDALIWVDDGTISSAGDLYFKAPATGGSQSAAYNLSFMISGDLGGV